LFAADNFAVAHPDGVAGSISLRAARVGGALLETAKVEPPWLLRRARRMVFLVHGFNVSANEADSSYLAFERGLRREVRAEVVRIYWPGDAALRSDTARERKGPISQALSGLSYLVKPKVARRSSEKLIRAIGPELKRRAGRGSSNALKITIVAHSLGCRLALETVRLFAVNPMVDMPLVVLMAAAVPKYEVLPPNGTYCDAISELERVVVMHSFRDTVLSRLFRPGSAPDRPLHGWRQRGALGRSGIPATDKIAVVEGEWDHSDYWPDSEISSAVSGYLDNRGDRTGFERLARSLAERRIGARALGRRSFHSVSTIM